MPVKCDTCPLLQFWNAKLKTFVSFSYIWVSLQLLSPLDIYDCNALTGWQRYTLSQLESAQRCKVIKQSLSVHPKLCQTLGLLTPCALLSPPPPSHSWSSSEWIFAPQKKKTSLAAALVALVAIRDSAEGFPPLKSVAASIIIMWDMTEVSFLSSLMHGS